MYPLTFLFRLFLGTLFYAFPAFTYAASFQAFQRSRQKIFQIAMSIPDFSDDEWEELSSSYQTLINNIVYEARVNDVPSPEFNYSFVADSDCDTDKEFFFSDLLEEASLIAPRSKPSPCQKPVSWFKVSTM